MPPPRRRRLRAQDDPGPEHANKPTDPANPRRPSTPPSSRTTPPRNKRRRRSRRCTTHTPHAHEPALSLKPPPSRFRSSAAVDCQKSGCSAAVSETSDTGGVYSGTFTYLLGSRARANTRSTGATSNILSLRLSAEALPG